MAIVVAYTDVENVWRPLTAAESEVVDNRLQQALRIIRHHFPTVDDRITSGELSEDVVSDIAVDMVVRYMRNPDGKRQEAIEDYSFTRDQATSSGSLMMTDAEMAMLTPARQRRGAFSITPARDCPTIHEQARAVSWQRWWRE